VALKRILESHAYLFLDAPFFHKDLLKPFLAAPSSSFPLKILAFKEVEKWSKKGYGDSLRAILFLFKYKYAYHCGLPVDYLFIPEILFIICISPVKYNKNNLRPN